MLPRLNMFEVSQSNSWTPTSTMCRAVHGALQHPPGVEDHAFLPRTLRAPMA
jgi:hypothetical protein